MTGTKRKEGKTTELGMLIGLVKELKDTMVTKEGLKIAFNEELAELKSQVQVNTIKSEWALRFVIGVLTTIGLTVLGAVLKLLFSGALVAATG